MLDRLTVTPGEIFLSMCCFSFYICFIFTVAITTFKKGYMLLGILGIFFPFLWLIGAVLPAKEGSSLWIQKAVRDDETYRELTR